MGVFINYKKLLNIGICIGILGTCTNAVAAKAEQPPLALLRLDVDGDGSLETAELYGELLDHNSGYHQELLLLLKDSGGSILTAYNPSIKGGYGCLLERAAFTGKGEQVILSVRQGDDSAGGEYRILDFADPKDVKEIFAGQDSSGIAAYGEYLPDFSSRIVFDDGTVSKEALPEEHEFYIQHGLYGAGGEVLKPYRRPRVGRIDSLVAVDLEQDGRLELLSLQNFQGLNMEDRLGRLTGVWTYDAAEGWQLQKKTFYSGPKNKDDKFRRSHNESGWSIFPRQAVYESNSVTYPLFVSSGAAEVQNKVNDTLYKLATPYLTELYAGDCEFDYTLTFPGDRYISAVIFGVKGSNEGELFHKYFINLDAQTGKLLTLADILDMKNRDLLPVLRVLTRNDSVDFSRGIPKDWYFNGTNFVFNQQNEAGEWLEAVASAEDLQKFLLRPDFLTKN